MHELLVLVGMGALLCREPDPPVCNSYPPTDLQQLESCRRDIEFYVDDVKRYTDCLQRERLDATKKAQQAVDQFNCWARGGRVC
jgi:hypothetical protein